MKPFELFRVGKHTSASGSTLAFGESDLQAAVAAYDPALHEAPIVVGHPKDNHPAYGWIKSLSFADGTLVAEPAQVDADFAEMVAAGRFKKRSASFYTPDSPSNPKPGTYYLRHVGFLGAQPPAVKGLRDVSFSEDDGVVEFVDSARYAWGSVAAVMRGIREWILSTAGLETADKIVPNFYLSDLEAAAKEARDAPDTVQPAGTMPAFSEEDPMTIAELQAQVAALTAERDALKANQKPADFAERETALAAREAKIAEAEAKAARATIEARVDAAIADGRLLKAQRKHAVDFAASLADGEAVIEFGEGDKAERVSQREAYLRQIEQGAKVVDFGEHARDTGHGNGDTSLQVVQSNIMQQVASGGAAAKK